MQKHGRVILILLSIAVITAIFVLLLIYKPAFRPWLIITVAVIGAVLAVMPTLLSDTPLIRWITAIVAGLCVGVGTWYTTFDFEHQKDELKRQNNLYSNFIQSAQGFPADTKSEIILHMANDLKVLFTAGRYADVNDMCDLLNDVYNVNSSYENGTALYYEGEVARIQKNREQMRGIFKRYLANADSIPESKTGTAIPSYRHSVDGYFGERTAWILHVMANDFYDESAGIKDPQIKAEKLAIALDYATKSIEICKAIGIVHAFEATTSLKSTFDIKNLSQAGLAALQADKSNKPIQ